jgi:hypothetical protein
VPLTEEQIASIYDEQRDQLINVRLVRAIEAAHGITGN